MLWLIYSILTALFFTLLHIAGKKFSKNCKAEYLALARTIMACVIVIPFIIVLWDKLIFNTRFFVILFIAGITGSTGFMFYMLGLKYGKLSRSVPLLNLSPIITVLIALMIVGEMPSWVGLIGILITIIGLYILNIEKVSKKNICHPFVSIFKNKGTRYMLTVTFIWGIGAAIDKSAVLASDVLTYILLAYFFNLFWMFWILLIKDRKDFLTNIKQVFKYNFWGATLIGIISLCVIYFQFNAIALTYAAYVITIKRTSVILSVIAGYLFFREKKHFATALVGAIIMVVGVVLLVV